MSRSFKKGSSALQASPPDEENHVLRRPQQECCQSNEQHDLAVDEQFANLESSNKKEQQKEMAGSEPQMDRADRQALADKVSKPGTHGEHEQIVIRQTSPPEPAIDPQNHGHHGHHDHQRLE